jgi:hypothetical protein
MNQRRLRVGLLVLGLTMAVGAMSSAVWSGIHIPESITRSRFVDHDVGGEAGPARRKVAEVEPKPFVRAPVPERMIGVSMPVTRANDLKLIGPDQEGKQWTYAVLKPRENKQENPMVRIGITNGREGPLAEVQFDSEGLTLTVIALNEADAGGSYTTWSDLKGVVRVSSWPLEEHSRVEVDLRGDTDGREEELHVCAPLTASTFEPLQPIWMRMWTR